MSSLTPVFYDNCEAERGRKRWTVAQTAEKLGIEEKTYRNRRDRNLDLPCSELIKYAKVFECSADYLLGLTDKISGLN